MVYTEQQVLQIITVKEKAEAEARDLRRNLKEESMERDLLDEKTNEQEKRLRMLDKRMTELKTQLQDESSERDKLDLLNGDLERAKRQVDVQLTALKRNYDMLQADLNKAKDERIMMRKKIEEERKLHEKEIDEMRDLLRKERRAAKDVSSKLENEREDLLSQLSKTQSSSKRESTRAQTKISLLENDVRILKNQIQAQSLSSSSNDPRRALENAVKEKLDAENQKNSLVAELTQLKEQFEEANQRFAAAEQNSKKFEQELQAEHDQLEEEKLKSTQLAQSLRQVESDLKDASTLRASQQAQQEAKDSKQIQELRDQIQDIEKERRRLADVVQQLEDALAEAGEATEQASAHEEQLAKEAEEAKLQLVEYHNEAMARDAENEQLLAQAEERERHLMEKLTQEYKQQQQPESVPAEYAASPKTGMNAEEEAAVKSQLAAAQQQLVTEQQKRQQHQSAAAAFAAQLEEQRRVCEDTERRLTDSKGQLAAAEQTLTASQKELASAQEQLSSLRQESDTWRVQAEQLKQDAASLRERAEADAVAAAKRAEADVASARAQAELHEQGVKMWKEKFESTTADLAKANADAVSAHAAAERAAEEQAASAKELDQTRAKVTKLEASSVELQEKLQTLTAKHSTLDADYRQKCTELVTAAGEAEQLSKQAKDLSTKVASLTNENAEQAQEKAKLEADVLDLRQRLSAAERTATTAAETEASLLAAAEKARRQREAEAVSTKEDAAAAAAREKALTEERNKLRADLDNAAKLLEDEKKEAKKALAEAEQRTEKAKEAAEEAAAKQLALLEAKSADLLVVQAEIEKLKKKREEVEKQSTYKKAEEESTLEQEKTELGSQLASLKEKLAKEKQKRSALRHECRAKVKEMAAQVEAQANSQLIDSENAVKEKQTLLDAAKASAAELEAALCSARAVGDAAEKERRRLQSELAERDEMMGVAETKAKALAAELAKAKEEAEARAAAEATLKRTQAEMDRLRKELDEKADNISDLKTSKGMQDLTLKQLTLKCNMLKEELQEAKESGKESLSVAKRQVEELLAREASLRAEADASAQGAASRASATLQARLDECAAREAALKVKADSLETQSEIDKRQHQLDLAELKKSLANSYAEAESLRGDASRLQTQYADTSREVERLRGELSAQREKAVTAAASTVEAESLRKEVDRLRDENSGRTREVDRLKELLAEKAKAEAPMPASAEAAPAAEVVSLRREVERLQVALAAAEQQHGEAAEAPSHLLPTVRRAAGPAGRRVPSALMGRSSAAAAVATTGSAVEPSVVEASILPSAPARPKGVMEGAVAILPPGGMGMGGAGVGAALAALKKRPVVAAEEKKGAKQHKLIQLKGRRRIRTNVVETCARSLNSGDVFVLDAVDRIYQWNGAKCNRMERTKGVDVTQKLNRVRGGRAKIITLDEEDVDHPELQTFWRDLGGKGEIQTAEAGGDDAEYEQNFDSNVALYLVTDDGDLDRIEGKLVVEKLQAEECYVLDCFTEVYVFIGKGSTSDRRNTALARANALLAEPCTVGQEPRERPSWCEVVRCNQGGESVLFCDKFANWPEDTAGMCPKLGGGNIAASKKQEKIDVTRLCSAEPPEKRKDADDGAGQKEIWKIVGPGREDVDVSQYGQFYSSHSYVILYTYGNESDRSYILYFWQGVDSSKNDCGTSAAVAQNMTKQYRGASHVRVPQQCEPAHFRRMFNGRIIIHRGSADRKWADMTCMYHVRGTDAGDCLSAECECDPRALNTTDAFVLLRFGANGKDEGEAYLWAGKHASEYCKQVAADVAKTLLPGVAAAAVSEGCEPTAFWHTLCSSATASAPAAGTYADEKPTGVPRFFAFSTRTGVVSAEPVWTFTQSDLATDSMVLLDAWDAVYVWFGPRATRENHKKVALETAVDYAKYVQAQQPTRGSSVAVLQVADGDEPPKFTACFQAWRRHGLTPIAGGRFASAGTPAANRSPSPAGRSAQEQLKEYSRTYTYQELLKKDSLPPTVDKSKLEAYLADEEFATVFGMSRAQYEAKPAWQKPNLKKQAGLY
eukprot:TRINITY_DN4414_c0_g1_i1.p1 TRINITY_DN4414_c0_g1~~TRINITY_DN4414_c0_g1_i1.p1  ORF type:complete len:2036 (-),score=696.95 TRINITY_DN4414_c0_g1_i1:86-6193(-)